MMMLSGSATMPWSFSPPEIRFQDSVGVVKEAGWTQILSPAPAVSSCAEAVPVFVSRA